MNFPSRYKNILKEFKAPTGNESRSFFDEENIIIEHKNRIITLYVIMTKE